VFVYSSPTFYLALVHLEHPYGFFMQAIVEQRFLFSVERNDFVVP